VPGSSQRTQRTHGGHDGVRARLRSRCARCDIVVPVVKNRGLEPPIPASPGGTEDGMLSVDR